MMHSNSMYNNHGPLQDRSSNSSRYNSTRIQQTPNHQRRRLSLSISMDDGSCHDLSNLSLKVVKQQSQQQKEQLFPSKDCVRRLPDIDDNHTLRLWEPLPRSNAPFHRANTTTTCTLKDEERTTHSQRQSQSSNTRRISRRNLRRSNTCNDADETAAPLSPPIRPSSLVQRLMSAPAPAPPTLTPPAPAPVPVSAPLVPPPPPTNTAPITPPVRPAEPGPRPKVNYKKLYGSGNGESKRDLRSSNRHISFQEQQLQRTLQEEERRQKEQSKGSSSSAQQEEEQPSPRPPQQQPEIPAPTFQYAAAEEEPKRRSPSPQPPALAQPSAFPSYNDYSAPPAAAQSPRPPAQTTRPPAPRGPPTSTTSGSSSQTVMEIAPNLFVPYKGSHETWEAVQCGQFTVTTCFACCLQLVVIDTAEFLVCPDCHTVSPLSYGGDSAGRGVERCGVGLGIKREWCDTEAALPASQQQQTSSCSATAANDESTPPSIQPFPTPTTEHRNVPPQQQKPQQRPSRPSYEQRHREKQAKYNDDHHHHSRSPSPEQEERNSYQHRRATFLI